MLPPFHISTPFITEVTLEFSTYILSGLPRPRPLGYKCLKSKWRTRVYLRVLRRVMSKTSWPDFYFGPTSFSSPVTPPVDNLRRHWDQGQCSSWTSFSSRYFTKVTLTMSWLSKCTNDTSVSSYCTSVVPNVVSTLKALVSHNSFLYPPLGV